MLGLLRTTLALMVMAFHLFVSIPQLGNYPVFGFYLISGYLMTFVMHESYGYTWTGRLSFAINRALRLYPQYGFAALFSVALIIMIGPETTRKYNGFLFLPSALKDWFFNISMLFPSWNPFGISPRIVPPTWSLTVEICFYVLIGLGISKTAKLVKIWLLLSLAYVLGSYALGFPSSYRYYPIPAASLPFAAGSSLYFLAKNNTVYEAYLKLKISTRLLFTLMLANCLTWMIISRMAKGTFIEVGFYLNILICTLLIYSIIKGGKIMAIKASIDSFIGDFSYPAYLLHWQTGLMVSYLMYGEAFHEFTLRGGINFMVSLMVIGPLSVALIFLIDKPIQRVRAKIKANKTQPPNGG